MLGVQVRYMLLQQLQHAAQLRLQWVGSRENEYRAVMQTAEHTGYDKSYRERLPSMQVMYMSLKRQRPEVPDGMPDEYRTLMQDCWAFAPSARPTFRTVLARLRDMFASPCTRRLGADLADAALGLHSVVDPERDGLGTAGPAQTQTWPTSGETHPEVTNSA